METLGWLWFFHGGNYASSSLFHLDLSSGKITGYKYFSREDDPVGIILPVDLTSDSSGNIWFSSPRGHLVRLDLTPKVLEVPVDIKRRSCPNPLNVRSRGVLPVAILGTNDFDVCTVDPASIRLMGIAPLRSALENVATPFEPFVSKEGEFDCTDEGPDDFLDLTLKFDAQEVV